MKARHVRRLRNTYRLKALVLEDSPVDLLVLREANRAFVVIGKGKGRSRSIERSLRITIEEDELQAWQILLAPTVPTRLDRSRLPLIALTDDDFVETIFRH